MTTTNINQAETITQPTTTFDGDGNPVPVTGKSESELRAAARRHGLTMKQLAARMGITPGHLSAFSTGRRPWSPAMREKAIEVLERSSGRGWSTGRAAGSVGRAATSGSRPAPWA